MSEMIFDLQRFSVINNKIDSRLVSGTSDDDKITNSAANVTIAAGGGNDSIVNKEYADNMSISGGAGNDTIRNNGEYSSNTTITGDAGNDFILNNSSDVTISGGTGNDNITNNGSYVSVSAGDGKDSVVNKGSNVTISGGAGNDTIKSTGENVLFQYEAGNDKISGFNYTSSLQIGDGDATYTEKISGNNIIITVGKDKITLEGAAALGNINVIGKKLTPSQIKLTKRADDYSNTVEGAIIDALAGNDSIYNNSDGSYSSILGGVGNDSIENDGSRVSIEGGLGNDYIGNWNDNYATTINGGAGNDHIENNGNFVIINGNEGNDTILSSYSNWYYGSNVTINGGDGNDSIRVGSKSDNSSINLGAGNDYLYTSGDNSTIIAGTGNDTIDINYERNEDYFHEANNGANNLFKYSSGDGNDLITGFRSDSTLQIGDGNDTYSSTVKGDDVIVTVGKGKITLVGAADKAVNIAGTAIYNGHKYRVFNDNMTWEEAKAYCESLGGHLAVITSAGEQDFVYSLADLGSKNYYWLGGYRGDNDIWQWVTKETFSYSNWASDEPNNNGGNENYIELYESVGSWNDNKNGDRSDIGFICEWEGGKAGSSKSVTLTAGNDSYKNTVKGATIAALGGNDTIANSGAKVKINGGTGNDSIINSGVNVVFNYANGDGNDKIVGFNATSTLNITSGTYSTTKSGSDIVVTVGKGKITLKGAASLATVNIKGTKAASTSLTVTDKIKSPVTVSAAVKTINASARAKAVQITGNKLDNSITGGSGKDSLYGGAGNDTILGNAGADKLYGQAGNDYLNGGAGNDSLAGGAGNNTLTGGLGNDVFFYGGGNDLITDYTTGDKIKISSGTAQVTTRGDNVVFTVGKGKLTVAGGKGKTISYADAKGEHTYSDAATSNVSINGGGTTIKLLPTYLNDSFNIADYGATLQNVDASAVLLDMEIIGNALRNSILGGANNETLIGGKGNDTLTGGTGSDVFTYTAGDGNDLITDYAEEDLISIASGIVSTIKTSGKNLIFTVGNGNITVAGAADKIVSYVEGKTRKTYGDETPDVEVKGKTVTLTENYTAESFDLSSYAKTIKTVNASAVTRDLEITANANANKIYGGSGNDTLIGGKGNDSLKGGSGSDLFIYSNGDGNDFIADYAEEDKIKIASGTANVKKSGSDVIFTVGSGKITVKGAASKTVTYIDASGKTNYFPTTPKSAVIMTDKNTTAILRETYSDSTYTAGNKIKKIDASAVTRDLSITGNGKANVIMGGYEDDTILGSKGNDTLQGGSGADVFTYAKGDGNDLILDYATEDKIQITKGTAQLKTSGSDVIFTVGSGKITVLGAADKTVSYVESGKTKTYGSASNILEDDNFITGNNLSALVKEKATDYFAVRESLIQKNNQLPSVTYSSKKKSARTKF